MPYKVVQFFDQSGVRPFQPGEIVKDGELTEDQIGRALNAEYIVALEEPKPVSYRIGSTSKTAKRAADTTMPKAD